MNLQLNPKEITAIQLSLTKMIEETTEVLNDSRIPWKEDAKRDLLEIIRFSKSALEKISLVAGHFVEMEEYKPGDEKEFIKG